MFNFLDPVSSLPHVDDIRGAWILGGDDALSRKNRAGGTALSKIGTPTLAANGATCTLSGCYNSNLLEALDFTAIAIFKPIVAATSGGAMLYSNYLNPVGITSGASFYMNGTTEVKAIIPITGSTASATVNLGTPVTTDWYMACVRADTTDIAVTVRHNATTIDSGDVATGSRVVAGANMRIGGHYGSSGISEPIEILALIEWGVKLNNTDRAAAMATLATFFADNVGITTL